MKKVLYAILAAGFCFATAATTTASAQNFGGISASDVKMSRIAGGVLLEMTITVSPDAVQSLQSVAVVPTLVNGEQTIKFPGVLVNGHNKSRIFKRHSKMRYSEIVDNPPFHVVNIDRKFKGETIDYSVVVEGENGVGIDAPTSLKELCIEFLVSSPAGERHSYSMPVSGVVEAPKAPAIITHAPIVHATPAVVNSLSGSAHLDFETGSAILVPNFKHNAKELASLEAIFEKIATDNPNARISALNIVGYSSPEGKFKPNEILARDRAKAICRYIQQRLNLPDNIVTINTVGEDWVTFRAAVAASNMPQRDALITIIDSKAAPDAKESMMRRMADGSVWRTMERDIFPKMRRVDYTIDYTAAE
jgi:hypothetical protein